MEDGKGINEQAKWQPMSADTPGDKGEVELRALPDATAPTGTEINWPPTGGVAPYK